MELTSNNETIIPNKLEVMSCVKINYQEKKTKEFLNRKWKEREREREREKNRFPFQVFISTSIGVSSSKAEEEEENNRKL